MKKYHFDTPMIDTHNSTYKPISMQDQHSFQDSSSYKMPQTQDIDFSSSHISPHHIDKQKDNIIQEKDTQLDNDPTRFIKILDTQHRAFEDKYKQIVFAAQISKLITITTSPILYSNSILKQLKQLRQNKYAVPQRLIRVLPALGYDNSNSESPVVGLNKRDRKLQKARHGQLTQNFFKYVNLFNEDVNGFHLSLDESKKVKSIFIVDGQYDDLSISNIISLNCTTTIVQRNVGIVDKWWISHSPDNFRLQYYVIQKDKIYQQDKFDMNFWLIKFDTFLRVVVLTFSFNTQFMNSKKPIYWHQDFKLKTNQHKKPKRKQNSFDRNTDFQQTLKYLYQSMIPQDFPRSQIDINLDDYLIQNVDIVLIPSIPGKYHRQQKNKYGLDKISKVIKHFVQQKQLQLINPIITTQCYLQPNTSLSYLQHFASCFNNNTEATQNNFRGIYPRYLIHPKWGFRSVRVRSDDLQQDGDVLLYLTNQDITPQSWGIPNQDNSTTYGSYALGILFLRYHYSEAMKLLPYDIQDVIKQPFNMLAQIKPFVEPDIRYMLI